MAENDIELRHTEKLESFKMRVGVENMRIHFTIILQIVYLYYLQAFLCRIYLLLLKHRGAKQAIISFVRIMLKSKQPLSEPFRD